MAVVRQMRSLWQILISFRENNNPVSLTCDECFQYMEHLAEEALAGADQTTLQEAIKDHLTNCPDCHEHHLRRLEQLEIRLSSKEDIHTWNQEAEVNRYG
jgi:Zn finger protein HypA/HybF involved in hydrogenase expression